jgi:hypothetical protein
MQRWKDEGGRMKKENIFSSFPLHPSVFPSAILLVFDRIG